MSEQWNGPELQTNEVGARAILTQKLLYQACAAFDLGTCSSGSDLGGTYNLNVLLLSPAGRYVLRVYRPWVSAERLKSIQQTKQLLAQRGLPVPQPLPMPSGEIMTAIEGRLVEVEPYIIHDHIADSWERYAQAFALLGSLHNTLNESIPSHFVPPRVSNYGTPPQLLRWVENTKESLQQNNSSQTTMQAIVACNETQNLLHIIDTWWQQAASSLPVQPIHGDYGGGNILFQGETIVAILDFDFLGIRERVYELAYTVYWMLQRLAPDIVPTNIPWEKIAKLLAFYNNASSHPLTQQELEAFPLEMARVPLYWIAEAGFTPQPLEAVQAVVPNLPFAQWLLDHASDIRRRLRG